MRATLYPAVQGQCGRMASVMPNDRDVDISLRYTHYTPRGRVSMSVWIPHCTEESVFLRVLLAFGVGIDLRP